MTEIRANPTEAGPTILEGYAAVYNSPSEDMGWGSWEVREYIAPGAFKKALEKNKSKRKLAAKELGISERTLYRKIKEYGIDI